MELSTAGENQGGGGGFGLACALAWVVHDVAIVRGDVCRFSVHRRAAELVLERREDGYVATAACVTRAEVRSTGG